MLACACARRKLQACGSGLKGNATAVEAIELFCDQKGEYMASNLCGYFDDLVEFVT